MSGTQDLVVAAGVENMAMVPIDANRTMVKELGVSSHGEGWHERYGDQEISQFPRCAADLREVGLSREDLERFSLESHQRAVRAIDDGRFAEQIAPIAGLEHDEGARRDTSLEKLAGLKALREGWVITAGVASQISVGAGALLVASEDAVRTHNLTPLARCTPCPWSATTPCTCSPARSRPPRPHSSAPG